MRTTPSPMSWIPLALLAPVMVAALIYMEVGRRRERAEQAQAVSRQEALRTYLQDLAEMHDQFRVSLEAVNPGVAHSLAPGDLQPLCARSAGARIQAEHYLSRLRSLEFPSGARELHFWSERELVAYLDYTVGLTLFCSGGAEGLAREIGASWVRGAEAGRRVVQEFSRLTPGSPLEPAVWAVAPTPTPEATPSWRVSVDLANVRACPRLDCAVVAGLQRGAEVLVVEEVEGEPVAGSATWYRVEAEGLESAAYMHASTVSPPTPEPPPPP